MGHPVVAEPRGLALDGCLGITALSAKIGEFD
jgi:hypothetical protein